MIARLTLRDVVFLAVVAACLLAVSFLVVPLVISLPIPGIRSLAPSPFYGLLLAVALLKVRQPGTLFVVVSLVGLVLLMMAWVMFAVNVIAGALAELIVLAVFRSYQRNQAVLLAAGLYMPLTVLVSLGIGAVVGGPTIAQFLMNPWLIVPVLGATALLSFIGAWAGLRLGQELRVAGVLRA
jgi:energy-coupling factor transport system substrate-specific component